MLRWTWVALALTAGVFPAGAATPSREILNASYDATRAFYQDYNRWFETHWREKTGETVVVRQSHGGSGKQARAVIDGLGADVVTLALAGDIDAIVERSGHIAPNWRERLPSGGVSYYSTIVFLTRRGNPKNIRDWEDLARPGVSVITPNPKTSGGARWNFLGAWAFGLDRAHTEAGAREFVARLYRNVPVLDSGARGAAMTFGRRRLGDALIAWESEALLLQRDFPEEGWALVRPSISVRAEPCAAWVDDVVARRGTRDLAEAYLKGLHSPAAADLARRHYFRVGEGKTVDGTRLVSIDAWGGWRVAQRTHFSEGGTFDEIFDPGRR
ncbi:MAG: sulfate ABC transporter substrate-binding protein [Elusimicrobia bacterium]|jgi:sulfate/thiosulfate-binding protein|nr:sulfate ABC transporter substrate-binding protein [Elusimicrobiota bacterium]